MLKNKGGKRGGRASARKTNPQGSGKKKKLSDLNKTKSTRKNLFPKKGREGVS